MKFKIIFSVLLLTWTGCTDKKSNSPSTEDFQNTENHSENIIKNDLTEENLKGNIKYIKLSEYEAVEKFGKIIKGKSKS
ncbi:hypothetical protein [Myroides indicus]|uniref:Lipoprotein n=1 Tax=Myroides indicus TaxID=1323422 RepID=A0A4R7EYA2_9FLAO|nr:hypothetical protein [Myroides indicus]TDS54597.1 hypothetical protein C8P70_12540 [Myroides indicus]